MARLATVSLTPAGGRRWMRLRSLVVCALISLAVACAPRFPPICVAASAVRIESVHWTTGDTLQVIYFPPYTQFSRWAGAEVSEADGRIEVRVMERFGRGKPAGRQELIISNGARLPVVITDGVEEFVIWTPG